MGTQTWLRFVRGFCVLAVAKNFSDSGNFEKHLGKMKANKTPFISTSQISTCDFHNVHGAYSHALSSFIPPYSNMPLFPELSLLPGTLWLVLSPHKPIFYVFYKIPLEVFFLENLSLSSSDIHIFCSNSTMCITFSCPLSYCKINICEHFHFSY